MIVYAFVLIMIYILWGSLIFYVQISTGKNDKGLKLYDPGYLNTAPVRSTISYIDGDEGILRYRGYPIEELAEKSTFVEVSYLIMYGSLPSESQLAEWNFAISQHSAVPQGVLDIIQSMPHDAHPMGVLVNALSALSVFHPDANPALRGLDIYNSKEVRDKQIARVIGKVFLFSSLCSSHSFSRVDEVTQLF